MPLSQDVRVDIDNNTLVWKTITCQLTPNQAILVKYLVDNQHRWVHSDTLMQILYGAEGGPESQILSVMISYVRRRLRDAEIPLVLESGWHNNAGGFRYRARY